MNKLVVTLLCCSLAVPAGALAQDASCGAPLRVDAFQERAREAADALLFRNDADAFWAAEADLRDRVICLDGKIDTADWAFFLYHGAVARHAKGDVPDAQAWVAAVLDAKPDYSRDFGHPDIRQYTPPKAKTYKVPGDIGGASFFVDGSKAGGDTFTLIGPHVLQRLEDGVWTSAWVADGDLPAWWGKASNPAKVAAADPVAPAVVDEPAPKVTSAATRPTTTSSSKRHQGLIVGGAVTAGVGAALAGTSLAVAFASPPRVDVDPLVPTLQAMEITGWAALGTGVALAITGAVLKSKGKSKGVAVSPSPGGMTVAGRF